MGRTNHHRPPATALDRSGRAPAGAGAPPPAPAPAVARLAGLQAKAGNAATSRHVAREVVQRMGEEAIAEYFKRWAEDEDRRKSPDYAYLLGPGGAPARKKKGKDRYGQRRHDIAAPAESEEQLDRVLAKMSAEGLDALVQRVKKNNPQLSSSLQAVFALSSGPGAKASESAQLEYLYRAIDRRGLDARAAMEEADAITALTATQLREREEAAEQRQRAEAEAAALVETAHAAGVARETSRTLLAVPGGAELLRAAIPVITHDLNISPRNARSLLDGIAAAAEGERADRVRGFRYEFDVASEVLAKKHVVQMGTMDIEDALGALDRIYATLGLEHPSEAPLRYLRSMREVFLRGQAQAGADVIDWTQSTMYQAKTTGGALLTAIGHVVSAVDQVRGRRREQPVRGPRVHLQAVVRIEHDKFGAAAVMASPEVRQLIRKEDAKTLSVRVVTPGGTEFFVPNLQQQAWSRKGHDPAVED